MTVRSTFELGSRTPLEAPPETAPRGAALPEHAHDVTAFATMLRAVGRETDQGETLVRSALAGNRSGRDLGASQLLALQAGIYRYGEVVDLATKLVDHASTDLKTVLQGQ